MGEFQKPPPLKISCTSADCSNNLHCFKVHGKWRPKITANAGMWRRPRRLVAGPSPEHRRCRTHLRGAQARTDPASFLSQGDRRGSCGHAQPQGKDLFTSRSVLGSRSVLRQPSRRAMAARPRSRAMPFFTRSTRRRAAAASASNTGTTSRRDESSPKRNSNTASPLSNFISRSGSRT